MSYLAYVVRQLLEQLEVGLDVRDLRLQLGLDVLDLLTYVLRLLLDQLAHLGPDELDLIMSYLAYAVRVGRLSSSRSVSTCATFGSKLGPDEARPPDLCAPTAA